MERNERVADCSMVELACFHMSSAIVRPFQTILYRGDRVRGPVGIYIGSELRLGLNPAHAILFELELVRTRALKVACSSGLQMTRKSGTAEFDEFEFETWLRL